MSRSWPGAPTVTRRNPSGGDVVADLEAEGVTVEAEGLVGIVDGDEHGGDGDFHATNVRARAALLLRSCSCGGAGSGLGPGPAWRVPILLTHAGTVLRSRWSRARYCEGVSPTISVKRKLNEPSDVHPTATQASVTDIPCRSSALARSIRRVIR